MHRDATDMMGYKSRRHSRAIAIRFVKFYDVDTLSVLVGTPSCLSLSLPLPLPFFRSRIRVSQRRNEEEYIVSAEVLTRAERSSDPSDVKYRQPLPIMLREIATLYRVKGTSSTWWTRLECTALPPSVTPVWRILEGIFPEDRVIKPESVSLITFAVDATHK